MAFTGFISSRSRRSAFRAIGWNSLFLFAVAISACGPSGDTPRDAATPNAASSPVATAPPAPTQADLAAKFDASTAAILEAKRVEDFAKFKPLNQVVLTPTADGLKITASGTDPQILLPPFAEGKPCIVQVTINLPVETPVQIFYSLHDSPSFSEAQSQLTTPLAKGRDVVYFLLDQPGLIDPVRLDPGASPGDYLIESVVARAIMSPAK